ncbi:hypothetical protein [Clostridium felsineum]|uniref:hypothetical protein n=1 Tax=Clostridium felsineum TaxID=36839 RepID=UPI00098BEE7A|nr:hypothetical protein [Clostridium felsineum]URZ02729.1 hypothetical protein CLAUR_027530 [Clostridium felsineum]
MNNFKKEEKICELYSKRISQKDIATQLGISDKHVRYAIQIYGQIKFKVQKKEMDLIIYEKDLDFLSKYSDEHFK